MRDIDIRRVLRRDVDSLHGNAPDTVVPHEISASTRGETITIELPPLSVTTIEAELAV